MLDIRSPKLSQVASVVGGRLYGDNAIFDGVTIDSRQLISNQLFVAINGANHDAHDFLQQVVDKSAAGSIVERLVDVDLPQIVVNNSITALQKLARIWRKQLNIPLVGITGSNGKTSVKEMCAHILSIHAKVLKTDGNFNNEIGLPLTLLNLRMDDEFAVVEMGASHEGEIDTLAAIACPTISLVNNIGRAHIEGFGDEQTIAKTKGAIYKHLPSSGVAVMPFGTIYESLWQEQSSAKKTVYFGSNSKAEYYHQKKANSIVMHAKNQQIEINCPIKAAHWYLNASAACAICSELGVDLNHIKQGLESMPAIKSRLQTHRILDDLLLIDDTYNANPASAKAAIDYLTSSIADGGETWLVLGDMGELGKNASVEHTEIGQYAKNKGVNHLLSVGSLSRFSSDVFGGYHFNSQASLLIYLEKHWKEVSRQPSSLLIKGSRFMQMDKVVSAIQNFTQTRQMEIPHDFVVN